MKFQSNLSNFVNFFVLWKNMITFFMMYVTKCIVDVILKAISIRYKHDKSQKNVLPTVALYCHKYSADFTYLMSLARELFLQSQLTFRENGRIEVHHEI